LKEKEKETTKVPMPSHIPNLAIKQIQAMAQVAPELIAVSPEPSAIQWLGLARNDIVVYPRFRVTRVRYTNRA
jgi:hypothetical protein